MINPYEIKDVMENEGSIYEEDFPFQEYRQESGDYFGCIADAISAGFQSNQIWSVVESG